MSDRAIAFESLADLAKRISRREISSLELAEIFLKRIGDLNDRSKSFITVTGDLARQQAAARDKPVAGAVERGPLHGVPYACKDLIDVKGVLTTGGSKVLSDNVATENAFAVDRMAQAGAVMLGKTNLHEFAYGATGENPIFGTAVNPYDATRMACGSSSGSAAAVGHGMSPAALGTDTGGSVRAPAVLCGLVGMKPTIGRISTYGVVPLSWSLDHVGTLSRTVEDAAMMLQAMAGFDPRDPGSANPPCQENGVDPNFDLSGLRIGIPETFYFERVDPEILGMAEEVIRFLGDSGAQIVKVHMPSMEHCRTVSLTVQMPEALSFHSRYLEERGDLYGTDFRAGLALGQCLLAEHYIRAKRFMAQYRQQTSAILGDVDVILTPATPTIAPELGTVNVKINGVDEAVGNAVTRFTTFFNMTGHPALTFPCAMHSTGLPMGGQLVGGYFEEGLIFNLAAALKREDRFKIPPPNIG